MPSTDELVRILKTLADANRLTIIGLLARRPHTVEQLASALSIGSPTVSHHLRRLAQAGLVHARVDGPYRVYELDPTPLHELAREFDDVDDLPRLADDADLDAFDRKVLATFVGPDGRFTAFPAQAKKALVLVRHALRAFDPGVRYSEGQVGEILRRFTDDTARVRRAFVDHGLMARTPDGSAYWRVDDRRDA
jgi:DNA-binding transcriptional ArsR family regulator